MEAPLANFFASGVLALGHKLGPILWQLPARMRFDAERLTEFFELLPRTTRQASALAKSHDDKLKAEPLTKPGTNRTIRNALVVADSAGTWPHLEDVTADFVYLRLHGAAELYANSYGSAELDEWAAKIAAWRGEGHDAYVYFDNDVKAHAPTDAIALAERLGIQPADG